MAPAIYVSNSLTRVTWFISQNLSFSFLVTWSSGSGDGNAQATFRDSQRIFPIHEENLGQDIPFLGRFWGFIRGKCLLFFYIPILGIGCEFSPKLFPKLGTIWEHFPRVIPYIGELLGHVNPNIGELLGRVNPNIRELLIQEKSIKGLLLDKSHWGEIFGTWKTLYGGKLCEILVLRLILVASFGIFSQTDFIHRLWIAKSFLWWASPLPFFFFAGIWENIFFHFLEAFVSLRWLVF